MLPEYFAIIGAVIASLGGFYYLYQTIIGKAKPNRITWLLWGIFPMVTFVAQRVQDVHTLSWVTFASGFTPFLVLAASLFNKKAYWQTRPLDFACLALGVVGMVLWAITKDPNAAILFSILVDLAAGTPTVIKAWTHPETESSVAYSLSTLGFGLGVLSIHNWTFQNYAFLVYLLAVNGLLALLSSRHGSVSIKPA